ncbi:hypothetical protein Lfu02_23820 [Longispora fulva]|uniref:Uncharacterized protein n=1 Tax=Longispora fulva TaxID=619741 RepID=A0A8J7GFA7_9ACTN|nr:hypothetical protein [Longispora fulva]MBG6139608.1 hypothetical protein [Longispora fulva]GIG58010.1 hypothetical protein Lfu02_23820 [Longispora fulva]
MSEVPVEVEVLTARLGILDTTEPDESGRCAIIGVRIDGPGRIDGLAPDERVTLDWDGIWWTLSGTPWSRVGTWRLVDRRTGHLVNTLPMEDETVSVTLVPGLRYELRPIRRAADLDREVPRWELTRCA